MKMGSRFRTRWNFLFITPDRASKNLVIGWATCCPPSSYFDGQEAKNGSKEHPTYMDLFLT